MRRERLYALISVLLTAVFILGTLELAVRTAFDSGMQFDLEMWKYARELKRISGDPRIGHEHRPGARAHLMGVDVAINSVKLRDVERSYAGRAEARRILMLGDSITFGWGVRAEETFSKRLQDRFAQAGMDVEVINTGVGNYNTSMEVAYFLAEGQRFEPDVVVLNYFINDAERTPMYDVSRIERASEAYAFLKSQLDIATRMLGSGDQKDWQDYYHDLYRPGSASSGWHEVKRSIAELARVCHERGISLMIANIPEIRRLDPYPFEAETAMLREVADQVGVPFLDLLPALRGQDPSGLWVTRPDPHPNGVAHGFFAEAMFEPLRALLESAQASG
jgi:lysophospholipase L1-like esterase